MQRMSREIQRGQRGRCFRSWVWIPTGRADSQTLTTNTLLPGTGPGGKPRSLKQGNGKRVKTFLNFERLSNPSGLRVENRTQHAPEICHFVKRVRGHQVSTCTNARRAASIRAVMWITLCRFWEGNFRVTAMLLWRQFGSRPQIVPAHTIAYGNICAAAL